MSPPPWVSLADEPVVLHGVPDRAVPLHGQHHRDVDAAAEDHAVELKKEKARRTVATINVGKLSWIGTVRVPRA